MTDNNFTMRYPLLEKIGNPDLLVGREKIFRLLDKWLQGIPGMLSKSRAILARKKSGKTAIVQRIFNQLWSENGVVIPFYFNIPEKRVWYPTFAAEYYCTFASQYISFLERDEKLVRNPLSLEEIKEYGLAKSIKLLAVDVDSFHQYEAMGFHDSMWNIAHTAPHRFAGVFDQRILVILDEFQNISEFVYRDEKCTGKPDDSLPGSYHEYSESKVAPMLVTGSYIGWMIRLMGKYLEAGRLKITEISPMLTGEEGLQAVYKYAEVYDVPITNETAVQINRLCMSDPFFISCVIKSDYENKDLTGEEGVINTVNYELSDENAEMFKTWTEYIEMAVKRINNTNAKNILLCMSKHADREWTPKELKKELNLDISPNEIHELLEILAQADVIDRTVSDIRYQGLQDGVINLILRNRFEEEISAEYCEC